MTLNPLFADLPTPELDDLVGNTLLKKSGYQKPNRPTQRDPDSLHSERLVILQDVDRNPEALAMSHRIQDLAVIVAHAYFNYGLTCVPNHDDRSDKPRTALNTREYDAGIVLNKAIEIFAHEHGSKIVAKLQAELYS